LGQSYNETRMDLEASIAGASTENLFVTEVIKPIIRQCLREGHLEKTRVIQNGIVVVESREKKEP